MEIVTEQSKPLLVLVPRRDEARDASVVAALVLGFIAVFIALYHTSMGESLASMDMLFDNSGAGAMLVTLVLAGPFLLTQRFRAYRAVRCEFYPDHLRYRFRPDSDDPETRSIRIPYVEIRGLKMRQGPRQARRGVADIRIGIASRKMRMEASGWLGGDFFLYDVPVADHQFEKIHGIIGGYFREHPDAIDTRRHLEDGKQG